MLTWLLPLSFSQEYDWNEKHKSYILSSFYWGYILTLCPGSFLCRRYGAKVVLFVACFGTAVFSLMTPWCITWGGWQVFCAIRIVQGLFQGVIFPCVTEHLAMWSPPEERNRLGAFSYTGTDCGTVLAMFISGMIAKGAMGWPGISYVSGSLCAAWCFLWLIFAANNATESRFIGEEECKYIESSLEHNEDFHERSIPIPWRAIWTSVPFLALLVARCSETYGLSTLQAEIPSYMNGVLNMDIQSNAVFSSLPFLAMWLLSYVYLIAADVLLKKKFLSLTSVRKLFNTLSFWIPAGCLIGIGFLSEDHKKLAIILMTVSVGVNSGATIGSSLNSIDLSPNHAGILIGLSNTVANVIPILTPLIAGVIVADKVSHVWSKIKGNSGPKFPAKDKPNQCFPIFLLAAQSRTMAGCLRTGSRHFLCGQRGLPHLGHCQGAALGCGRLPEAPGCRVRQREESKREDNGDSTAH